MKYRKLKIEELKSLESEFIRFLASNTVTASDWEKVKKEDPPKAEELIEIFSDIVIGQALERVKYLDLKGPKNIRSFYCQKDKITLKGLLIEGESDYFFNIHESPEKMLANLPTSDVSLQIISAERAYQEEREMELFKLMEQGALISKDGNLFTLLWQLK